MTASSEESLGLLVDLAKQREALRGDFPRADLRQSVTRIAITALDEALLGRFQQALRHHFGGFLKTLDVEFRSFVIPEVIPATVAETVDCCWLLFPADRFDLRGQDFTLWAEHPGHRRLLTRASLHGIRLFPGDMVKRWNEPISPIDDERVVGRSIPVVSLVIEGRRSPIFGINGQSFELTDLMGRLILFLLAGKQGKWSGLVSDWDTVVAGLLERRASRLAVTNNGGLSHGGPDHADEALMSLGRFFDLHRASGAAARRIDAAAALARDLDRRALADHDLQSRIAAVTARINDARLPVREFFNDGVVFTEAFQLLRFRLLALAAEFAAQLEKRGLSEHASVLRGARRNIERNLTVVLLGAFSSGKSTFVNSMLRLDKDPLPTSGKPETATINILEYGEDESVEVDFAETIDLPLLSSPRMRLGTDEPRFMIHRVEIEALIRWIEAGEIDVDAAEVEVLVDPEKPPRSAPEPARIGRRLVRKLRWLVENADRFVSVRKLASKKMPRRITNLRFVREPFLPRDRAGIHRALSRPEIALRVDSVLFRRRIETLRGASIVDTPGTDSAIPHHHTLAHSFLERRPGSPVLYCFDGTRVCSEADSTNIDFLRELQGERDRVFFVITKRGICAQQAQDEAEIRAKVDDLLRSAGFAGRKAYFVDSIQIRDGVEQSDWTQLTEQLRNYVERSRTRVLRRDADGLLLEPLRQLRRETQEQIDSLTRSGRDRKLQAEKVSRELDDLVEVSGQLTKKATKARKALFKVDGEDFLRVVDEVLDELHDVNTGALKKSTRDERTEEIRGIVAELDAWPKKLLKSLAGSSRYLHGFVASKLAELGVETSTMTAKRLPAEFALLELADIRRIARETVTERQGFWDGWIYKYSFKKGLNKKRDRLVSLIKERRDEAKKRSREHFDSEIAGYYRRILNAHKETLAEKLTNLTGATGSKETVEVYEERLEFLDGCLKELQTVIGNS